jgi:integrase
VTARRSRGDGGLHWDGSRKRWIATITVGYDARGKRVTRKASGKTKTEAKLKLREILRDHEDGLTVAPGGYTVGDAVRDWLQFGLSGRDEQTVKTLTSLAENHVIPGLGARQLRELSADDVDRWLAKESKSLSTRSLESVKSILKRAVTRAQARDKVKRNVVLLCETPKGKSGRPSKALTLDQAEEVLAADDGTPMHAYIVVSLLTGARTEEMRGLRWDHVVAFDEQRQAWIPVPEAGWSHKKFAIYVWRSVRVGGDTKTKKSRRSLALPKRATDALRTLWDVSPPGRRGSGLVFSADDGKELDKDTVRRAFRRALLRTSLDPKQWAPREMRHSFVSLLDDANVPIEKISRLVGHADTTTTETVYRFQIRPVIQDGATAMDEIFPDDDGGAARWAEP